MNKFLPINKKDLQECGIEQLDFICVTGDSYVDHPSFGVSIISRVIEGIGYTVGIIAQPNYNDSRAYQVLGRPKYAFLVTSGNIDSMVAHYTASKRKRSDDAYTAGGKAGARPDRAVIVYTKGLKQAYPDVPVVIGGLEASLRRFAHYDYWDDVVMPSILVDSGADLLTYGMGENQTIEICNRLAAGEDISTITDIKGTCYLTKPKNTPWGGVQCPDYSMVKADKVSYAKATKLQMNEQDDIYGKTLLQRHDDKMLVQNSPMPPLTQTELDWVYSLPYMRYYHPSYEAVGGVDAIKEVEFSITHNRGCFGSCNFCSIAFHQGRKITTRSEESVLAEAEKFTHEGRFKGYIHDLGGPTANFRLPSCKKQAQHGMCKDKKCLAPTPCKALEVNHDEYLGILRKMRAIKGIKKVFIRSGLRYDYMLKDESKAFFNELIEHHISGQLKVAPEHCSAAVLDSMGKPYIESFVEFSKLYFQKTKQLGKEQYLVPYLMSSHPASELKDAIELALFLKKMKIRPEQVQDFYPTPGTVSTCMYHTGLDPMTLKPVYVAKTAQEKAMQRALLQYYHPKNTEIIIKALQLARRTDLIGVGEQCLVKGVIPKTPNQGEKKFKRLVTNKNKNRKKR